MFNIFSTRIDIQDGELLKAEADGLVIPTNDHLWMGAGSAMTVKQAGGEEIEVEAVRQGPLPLGQAVATGAGELPYRRIYHAVIMGQDLKVQHDQIPKAVAASLQLAAKEDLASLVVAPLESEELTGPFHDATRLVVTALFDVLGGRTPLKRVLLSIGKPDSLEAYREAFHQALQGNHN